MHALLDHATTVARAAAAAILDVKRSSSITATEKADHSPVTAADLAADAIIRAQLAVSTPIVTEETWTSTTMPTAGRVWIVDPLDGTKDFVAGRPDYVVQIGLVIDGVPRLGVVCQPETGRVWRGFVDDDGTRRCERLDPDGTVTTYAAATVANTTTTTTRPRLTISISHPSRAIDAVCAAIGADVVPRGSVGLKIGAILDDEADGYVTDSRYIKVWDTAAPAAIILAAGGSITSLSGTPLRYDDAVIHDDGVAAFGVGGAALRARVFAALPR
ncbi:MAG TPA: inositol monophosphatase family protein [Myxococcota bacterium]